MRVNIYSQEITGEVAIVEKWGMNTDGEQELFYGLRFYIKSPISVDGRKAVTVPVDNRSAVTFWLPSDLEGQQLYSNTLYAGCQLIENDVIDNDEDE